MTFVGVCGGRDFVDWEHLSFVLGREVPAGAVIVTGAARGADSLGDKWAVANGHQVVRVPALWQEFGKGAGPARNAVIAALPLAKLVAFPGGNGTADMVRRARAAGIPVVEVPA